MATNLSIDEGLLEEALRLSGQTTKKATVNEAVDEYIGAQGTRDDALRRAWRECPPPRSA